MVLKRHARSGGAAVCVSMQVKRVHAAIVEAAVYASMAGRSTHAECEAAVYV
jgi:hypothetical protein